MASNVKTTIDVYVKLPSGRTSQMDMSPDDQMSKVYDRIAAEEGVPVDRVILKYTGKVLKKSPTLGYLGVCAETILKAEIIQVKQWSIIVRLASGKTISVDIENTSPVSFIADQIEIQEGIPAKSQVIKLDDRAITVRTQSLIAAGIKNESLLTVEVKDTSVSESKKKSARKGKKTAKSTRESDRGSGSESGTDTDGSTHSDVTVQNTNEDDVDREAVLGSFAAEGKRVEVVFSFDTTGSMYSCLEQVRKNLKETATRLISQIPNIRIGIVAHGDYCDYSTYVLRMADLTSDVQTLVDFVENVPATGGGDSPECYEWVLHKAVHMDWSDDSAKALVVIGDCLPHEASYTDQDVRWQDELDLLIAMGVKVYGVHALRNPISEPFYQELSDRSGGAYINFKNFNIITEMFLAVCLREASDEQFEAYCEEVGQDESDPEKSDSATAAASSNSKKTSDIQEVLGQLKDQKDKEAAPRPQRYVADAWWDPTLDRGTPKYKYDSSQDTWSSIPSSKPRTPVTHSTSFAERSTRPAVVKRESKRRFSFRRRRPNTVTSDSKPTKKTGCVVM